jgi:hypothetical protein
MRFKSAYGIVPGVPEGGRAADKNRGDRIRIVEDHGVFAIIMSGPTLPAETLKSQAEYLTKHFEELYRSEIEDIQGTVRKEFSEAAGGSAEGVFGADSLFLFASVRGNRYLAGKAGGGLIAKLNGSCAVLAGPEAGLAGNESLAQGSRKGRLKIFKGELEQPSGFVLLSDGACRSLYDKGTGSLSSACGTFFEWLKEYDGETVSEALEDNIDKYFVKDVKGDISVALMVVDMESAEEVERQLEAAAEEDAGNEVGTQSEDAGGETGIQSGDSADDTITEKTKAAVSVRPVSKVGVHRKNLKYIVLAIIAVLMIVLAFALKQPDTTIPKDLGKAETQPPVAQKSEPESPESYSDLEPSVSFAIDNPKSYDAGEYRVGVDLPAGEYFFWTGEMMEPGSIELNGDTCLSDELYCMTIRVEEGDVLTTDCRFTEAENVNPVKPAAKGILISGKYKIGKDISPGKYKIKLADNASEGRYYSILDGEISNDTDVTGDTEVTVPESGYIVFYRTVLIVK